MAFKYLRINSKKKSYSSFFLYNLPPFDGNFNSNHPIVYEIFLVLGKYFKECEMNI